MSIRLDGKTVVIFGASGLIGNALVGEALGRGAHVIAIIRDENGLLTLPVEGEVEPREFELGTGIDTSPFDEDDRIDIVLTPLGGSLDKMPFAKDDTSSLKVAVSGKLTIQAEAVRLALPRLTEGGKIILFSGQLSRHPVDGYSSMSATNAAVEGLARALALELDPVHVQCISPAAVADDGSKDSVTPADVASAAFADAKSGEIIEVGPS